MNSHHRSVPVVLAALAFTVAVLLLGYVLLGLLTMLLFSLLVRISRRAPFMVDVSLRFPVRFHSDYFPDMASVVSLAPVAWWGMWQLACMRGIHQ